LLRIDEEKLKEAGIAANKRLQDSGLAFEFEKDSVGRPHPVQLTGDELTIPQVPRSALTA
jgi:hypothetical protein